MNVSRIANLKAGGERAPETAQSTYWSCYNTTRTQILNWSQSCRNQRVWTVVRFQPGQKPTVLWRVRVTTCQDKSRVGFWTGLEPNRTDYPVQIQSAGGLPRPIAHSHKDAISLGIFSDEWYDIHLQQQPWPTSDTLEEDTQACMVEVIAKYHFWKLQLISCRFWTSLLLWQGKEVSYS